MTIESAAGKSPKDWLGKLKGHLAESKRIHDADNKQRRDEEAKGRKGVILTKNEVQGDKWDAARVLTTTLGGVERQITSDDLATFRHNMNVARKNFTGAGITARQVIDLAISRPRTPRRGKITDIDRARDEIHSAMPVSALNGDVRFITNAGPDSDDTRHHVLVKFNAFGDVLGQMMAESKSQNKTPKQAATWLRKQKLAFDCDCGRHRYWFRYIATIGNFNAGRDEHGYPKIRNPDLMGVACKHVLRTMAEIESSSLVLNFLTKHLERVKASNDNRAATQAKQKEAEELAKKAKVRALKSNETLKAERQAARDRAALKKAVAEKKPPRLAKVPKATLAIESALKSGKATAAQIATLREFGFSDKEIAAKLEKKA